MTGEAGLVASAQVAHCQQSPARRPGYADPARPLSAASRGALAARGVGRLFLHQAQALDAVMAGAPQGLTDYQCLL